MDRGASMGSQRVGREWGTKQQLQCLEAAWVYAATLLLSPDRGATVLGFIRVFPDCPTFVFIPFIRCHFSFMRILYTRTHAIHSPTPVLVYSVLWYDGPWSRGSEIETRSNRSQDRPSFCALWLGSTFEVWSTSLMWFSVVSLCNAGGMSQGISVFLQPGEMPTGVWGDVCGRSYVQDILGPFFVFVNVDICCSVAKLCSTLCNPMDCNPPGSSFHGILQVRTLEWVAISFSRFPTQGSNLGLLHYRWMHYHLSHQGSPNIYIIYIHVFIHTLKQIKKTVMILPTWKDNLNNI